MQKDNIHNVVETLEKAEGKIKGFSESAGDAGVIESVKDGIVTITGLSGIKMGEVLKIRETGSPVLVLQTETKGVYGAILKNQEAVKPKNTVVRDQETLSVPVGDALLGRVVSPLGDVLDDGPAIQATQYDPVEQNAPGVIDRQSVHEPVETGIVAIDALIPVGRGQRELIIGDRQTGKTSIALDTIINQKGKDMICIYVSIAQRDSRTAQVVETLKQHGAMPYTIVLAAGSSESSVLHYLAPYSAMTMAEHFMHAGKHVLVVFDDLSKHAVAYRELSLLLRKPPGREAYPGDVFYIHSRLLERSAKLSAELGGGSITALPIIETLAGDVSAYIPTNVISITDGQIFLEPKLFYKGVRPAINVGISVSRVGGAAQTKIMKKVAGSLKLSLAQYYELAAFSQFASELDEESKQQLLRGERVVEVLKQRNMYPYDLWKQVVIINLVTNGSFDAVPKNKMSEAVTFALDWTTAHQVNLVKEITKEQALTDSIKTLLSENASKLAQEFSTTYGSTDRD